MAIVWLDSGIIGLFISTEWSPKLSTSLIGKKFIRTETYQQLLENTYSLFTDLAMVHNATI